MIIGISHPGFSQTMDNIPIPPAGNNFPGGTMAYDIIEANGFIFFYSFNKVFVYSPNAEGDIPRGYIAFDSDQNWGKFNPFYYNPRLFTGSINFMAYNEITKILYVVTPNMQVISIKVDFDQQHIFVEDDIISTYDPFNDNITGLDQGSFNPLCGSNIIKVDSENNRLYWVAITGNIEYPHVGNFHSRKRFLGLYTLDALNGDLALSDYEIKDNTDYRECAISDIAFNQLLNSEYYYITKLNRIEVRKFSDPIDDDEIFEFEIDGFEYFSPLPEPPPNDEPNYKFSKILYINSTSPHLIVFLPYRYPNSDPLTYKEADIFVLAGNHDNAIIKDDFKNYPVPSQRITDAAFLSGNNDLVLSYAPDENETTSQGDPLYHYHDIVVYHLNDAASADFTKLTTLNTDLASLSHDYDINASIQLLPININSLLISKKDEISKLSYVGGAEHYETTLVKGAESNLFGPGVNIGGLSYIINLSSNGFERINNTNTTQVSGTRTAYPVYHATGDQDMDKVYFFNKLETQGAGLYVCSIDESGNESIININDDLDASGNPYTDNNITKSIGDCVYNPYTDQFLIGERSNDVLSSRILVIKNDEYNTLESVIELPIDIIQPEKMFIAPNKQLYVFANMVQGEAPRILVYKVIENAGQTVYTLDLDDNIGTLSFNYAYFSSYFEYNPADEKVYATIHPKSITLDPYLTEVNSMHSNTPPYDMGSGVFCRIDEDQLVIIQATLSHPQKIICPTGFENSQYEGKMFIIGEECYMYDYINEVLYEYPKSFNDVAYCASIDQLFALSDEAFEENEKDHRIAKVYKLFNDENQILIQELAGASFEGQMGGMFHNEYDGKMYLFHRTDEVKRGDTEMRLISFNPLEDPINQNNIQYTDFELTSYYPEYDHGPDFHYLFYNIITPLVNPYNSTIYIPCGGHSCVSKVSFSPSFNLPLENGLNWISFPMLDRESNGNMSSVTALTGRIEEELGEDNGGEMEGQNNNNSNELYIDWVWFQGSGSWKPRDLEELNYVNTKKGYILNLEYISPPTQNNLAMFGELLSPNESIAQIYANADPDNWLGYWLPQSLYPLDAFSEVLEDLESIKGQDWFCARMPNPNKSTAVYKGGGEIPWDWTCPHTARLEFGDMVKVKAREDVFNFQYNWLNKTTDNTASDEVEYYSYTEQSSYEGLVIELDSGQNPVEIAAFVGDTCIGAEIVYPDDSLCHLQAYTEGISGDITIEQHFGSAKSVSPRITQYLVLNKNTFRREKRTIHTSEHQGIYFISLKDQIEEIPTLSDATLHCWPNPTTGICHISLYNPLETEIRLEVYDMYGRNIEVIEKGEKAEGSYTIEWDAASRGLNPGMYFIRLSSTYYSITQKIIYAE